MQGWNFSLRVPGLAIALSLLTFLPALSGARAQQPSIVKVGVLGSTGDVALHLAKSEGYFKAEGIEVDFVPFKSGAQMVAPLGTGQLDVAAGVVAAGLNNLSVRGVDLKIVSDRASMPPGHGYMQFLVRKDLVESGKYKTYADLKGMNIGTQSKGGAAESTLNELLKLGGLSFDDVNIAYLGHSELAVALGNKAIDAAFVTEPHATVALNQGSAVRIATGDQIYPNDVLGVMIYSGALMKNRAATAVGFMKAFLRACRLFDSAYKDGKMLTNEAADKVVAAYKGYTQLKDEALIRAMVPHGCDPDGKLNVDGMKKDYAFFKARGLIQGNVDIEQLIDMSFAERAVKELGNSAKTN
ncbi:ABC transporter substrate-binding protein [Bradyrhizobium mercantei]|uniref:ABC transporter substrate-binding protein n=1 Tax=Bradyrhizobium mercantei TaxID=1904807 RepID=UPI000977702A|nr:ABC transporter substrate-binding protein [Bradyrhizobium mercantei]